MCTNDLETTKKDSNKQRRRSTESPLHRKSTAKRTNNKYFEFYYINFFSPPLISFHKEEKSHGRIVCSLFYGRCLCFSLSFNIQFSIPCIIYHCDRWFAFIPCVRLFCIVCAYVGCVSRLRLLPLFGCLISTGLYVCSVHNKTLLHSLKFFHYLAPFSSCVRSTFRFLNFFVPFGSLCFQIFIKNE